MEALDSEVPLGQPIRRVAIIFNLKKGLDTRSSDAEAEYDAIETVYAIRDALEAGGLLTDMLEADESLPDRIRESRADIAFNIAEGRGGRGREAQIPAILNLLGMRFTGSDETALCVSLDKAMCKKLASANRIRTPRFARFGAENSGIRGLRFPVIVKPNAEGSSKGVSERCVVKDAASLRTRIEENLKLYGGEMLVEEYIAGREFTVGILGNGKNLRVFEPMEIVYRRPTQGDYHVYSYQVKQDYARYVEYKCPAAITPIQSQEMKSMAKRVYEMLGCRDFSRVDFRMDAEGNAYFIEINPLPGLAPGYSDYPMLAEFQGVPYQALVRGILDAAAQRYGTKCAWEVEPNEGF